MKTNCTHTERIVALISIEGDELLSSSLKDHLTYCESCRSAYQDTLMILQAAGDEDIPFPDSARWDVIWSRISRTEKIRTGDIVGDLTLGSGPGPRGFARSTHCRSTRCVREQNRIDVVDVKSKHNDSIANCIKVLFGKLRVISLSRYGLSVCVVFLLVTALILATRQRSPLQPINTTPHLIATAEENSQGSFAASITQVPTPLMPQDEHAAIIAADGKICRPDIKTAQEKLKHGRFDPGKIDGQWGPQTSKAVRRFQEFNGMNASGRLDATTYSLLLQQPENGQNPAAPLAARH